MRLREGILAVLLLAEAAGGAAEKECGPLERWAHTPLLDVMGWRRGGEGNKEEDAAGGGTLGEQRGLEDMIERMQAVMRQSLSRGLDTAEDAESESASFFDALASGKLNDSDDERDAASATLVRKLAALHASGDAYTPLRLHDGDPAWRRSAFPWAEVSGQAMEDLRGQSPGLFLRGAWVYRTMFAGW